MCIRSKALRKPIDKRNEFINIPLFLKRAELNVNILKAPTVMKTENLPEKL